VSLHGKKRLGKKDKKGWHYDKILVHFSKIGTLKVFNNLLGKEGKKQFLQKNDF
jgi:hypothetical protein